MKKILLAGAALVALTVGASAADLGRSRVPMSSAVYVPPSMASWTGAYAGLNIGYAFGNSALQPVATGFGSGNGLTVGAQLGYDYQVGSRFVVGAAVDASWANVSQQVAATAYALEWEGSARVRGGVLVTPDVLVYGTGGLAFGSTRSLIAAGGVSRGNLGWTVGAGAEYRFAPRWTGFAEYRYTDFGSVNFNGLGFVGDVGNTHHTVRAGVNYRFFSGPSAVSAKY